MIKTFITGIVLGIAGVIAALYLLPAVDQHREVSVISVAPNGGNLETFQVNIPMDRIIVGADAGAAPVPAGLDWPDDPIFAGARTELYKVRNSRNAVIGVASRLAASNSAIGNVIEWVVHLPARGSIYMTFDAAASGGQRVGQLRAGTREFEGLSGTVSERWVADTSDADDAIAGRIELRASYIASLPDETDEVSVE
ncbi:MAG: hypothetical protein R3288_13155 [Woeseiaceae bacterium]|nr:hypothetical protein [Woeseiaceae bacterium]